MCKDVNEIHNNGLHVYEYFEMKSMKVHFNRGIHYYHPLTTELPRDITICAFVRSFVRSIFVSGTSVSVLPY